VICKPVNAVRISATLLGAFLLLHASRVGAADTFSSGKTAYDQNNFPLAAQLFKESVTTTPAAGTFQNLGNAEWQNGRTAAAVIAWERALCLAPFDQNTQNNLKFLREQAQLEAPELAWYEIASTWLPAHYWAWFAFGSLWFAVGMLLLPGVFRWQKSALQQALVALGMGIFLLSLPANYGVMSRAHIGFVIAGQTPLCLTPTANAEPVTTLAAGEPGKVVKATGQYLFIHTRRASGWIERAQFELICP